MATYGGAKTATTNTLNREINPTTSEIERHTDSELGASRGGNVSAAEHPPNHRGTWEGGRANDDTWEPTPQVENITHPQSQGDSHQRSSLDESTLDFTNPQSLEDSNQRSEQILEQHEYINPQSLDVPNILDREEMDIQDPTYPQSLEEPDPRSLYITSQTPAKH
ncbi:hypothetical protein K435DRAFT_864167 [Dendrothele bispora CBS 962.96]|uniref:Uncharacterized protein n=1 Tax=Dendrothele bispora (strain CBS 962.96) TaxID=1314807 RepID=A0A4S8LMW2_DENBC|nr:hypothetical protein K435DRAFT_864167 [Dendrothele bispora CBS 962.96]